MNELQFLQHVVSETARMSYPGRFGGKLRARAKSAIQGHFEERYPVMLRAQINNYDRWHRNRVVCISRVIEEGNYKQDNNDTYFALSAKLLNTFMHQLIKYDRFRYLYKSLHLPLDRTVFHCLCKVENDHNELRHLRELIEPLAMYAYRFDAETYTQIQEELWQVVNHFNTNVLPKNCQIYSRIDLNCLLW